MMPVPASSKLSSVSTPHPGPDQSQPHSSPRLYFYAWTSSVVDLLSEQEGRGDSRQKNYSDTIGDVLRSTTIQLVEALRQLAEYRQPEEFVVETQSSYVELCEIFVLHMTRSATCILFFSSVSRTLLAVDAYWFKTLLSENLGDIHDCYVAGFAAHFKSIHSLDFHGPWPSLPLAFNDHFTE